MLSKYAVMYSVGLENPKTMFVLAVDEMSARLNVFTAYPRARIYQVMSLGSDDTPAPVIYVDFKTKLVKHRRIA